MSDQIVQRMRAGRLRHRVKLQTRTSTQDAHGNPVDHWTTADTVWADISPLRGSETLLANRVNASSTHSIAIRGHFVSTYGRIKFGSRLFDINSAVAVDERRITAVLECTEVCRLRRIRLPSGRLQVFSLPRILAGCG